MYRCEECRRELGNAHLLQRENRKMEAARQACGLDGVRFHYFNCPRCGHDNLFLRLAALEGETSEELDARRRVLESAIRPMKVRQTSVVVSIPEMSGQEQPQGSGGS